MTLSTPSSTHTTFFRFNDLLPELRLKVYEFALATPATLSLEDDNYLLLCERSAWDPGTFEGVALLRSSRKIYNEALPVFYAINHFDFDPFRNWTDCSTDLSNQFAMMRHISVGAWIDERWVTDGVCASRFNEFLHWFPRLHSFFFFVFRGYPRMPCRSLNETAEVLRGLRQRVKRMTIIVFFDDKDNLQGLRDVIAPHDEWRQQTGNEWHSYIIGPSGQVGIWDTYQSGCRIEEL